MLLRAWAPLGKGVGLDKGRGRGKCCHVEGAFWLLLLCTGHGYACPAALTPKALCGLGKQCSKDTVTCLLLLAPVLLPFSLLPPPQLHRFKTKILNPF